jgi:hypothetical protein
VEIDENCVESKAHTKRKFLSLSLYRQKPLNFTLIRGPNEKKIYSVDVESVSIDFDI